MPFQLRFSGIALRALILCGVFSAPSTFGQTDRAKLFETEDAYIRSEAATHFFRGAVLVGIDGKIAFEKAYGLGNEEWGASNTVHTKFRIASLTKQFTAACILLLQERGRLNVHDPISRYLPGLPAEWQAITVHQLLTHTAGIPNYTSSPEIKRIDRTGATPQQMIALVEDRPLDFTPGTNWSYSNTGYILLGMIVEKVSGQSYADFLQRNIFELLGMKDSGYDRARDIVKQRASGYDVADGHIINADFVDMSVPFSAGGIDSTVEDMYRWNEALSEKGRLLSSDSLKQMFTEYPEATHEGQHYGYGVVISRLKFGRLLYYHGGGVEGFSSSIQRYPNERVCIVVLSNFDSYKPWELGDHIAAALFNQPLPAAH
ncbi:MAG TPA: serine hydrolase domain-containing protein [Candidatus Sulfotelmatobacter sp.]|nr:serine hydrolase domain-containing protein [Candidatus Sulfotelmatobacter sp.]